MNSTRLYARRVFLSCACSAAWVALPSLKALAAEASVRVSSMKAAASPLICAAAAAGVAARPGAASKHAATASSNRACHDRPNNVIIFAHGKMVSEDYRYLYAV